MISFSITYYAFLTNSAVMAVSAGARGCLGMRFSMTESVCILANLVRRFEVLPTEELARFSSKQEMKCCALKARPGMTMTQVNTFVKLNPYNTNF